MKNAEPDDMAFPVATENFVVEGFTKREYFAAMAMQGLLASIREHQIYEYAALAARSVTAADALINALNKTP